MRKDEAINVLRVLASELRDGLKHLKPEHEKQFKEAYMMAIKSLKQPQIIRCKDCKHRVVNEHYGEKGYFKLKAYCDLDTGDIFELGRCAEDDDWFCADAERRTE